MLINRGCLEKLTSEKSFYLSLLDHLEKESKTCRDVKRYAAIINVGVGLIASVKGSPEAVALVCSLLLHEFPRVRSIAAEKIYVRLLETDPDLGEDHVAIKFLLEHNWESNASLEETIRKESIREVAKAFGIDDDKMLCLEQ